MKNSIIIAVMLMTTLALWAVSISHNPPANLNAEGTTDLRLQVIEGVEEISKGSVYWRVIGTSKWQKDNLRLEASGGQWYIAAIPRLNNPFNGVEYYFEFTMQNGTVITDPSMQPEDYAYQVNPARKTGRQENAFIRVSDEADITTDDGYIIAVSWFEIANAIDHESIRLFVNGRDITGRATVTQTALTFREDKPQPGMITAFVTAQHRDGSQIHSVTWSTHVLQGKRRIGLPFDYYGNFNVTTNLYGSSAESAATHFGDPQDDASSSLDLYTSYGILDLKTNLFVSSLEKTNKQPVNRFSIGLNIPYLEIIAGDHSPDFGHFTIRNRNVRGLFGRFHSPYLSVFGSHGEMVRKTTSSYFDGVEMRNTGTFKQEATAVRIQLGGDRGYMLAFNVVRNRDIKSSLDLDDFRYFVFDANNPNQIIDTLYTVLPQDNLVAGIEMKISLPDQHVVIGFEGAGSIFNRNTLPGPLTAEEFENYTGQSIPIDPDYISGLFTLNMGIEPLQPASRDQTAWRAYYRGKIFNNLINVSYSEVGSAFRALSTSFQQTDTRNVSITNQLYIKQYLMATLGYNRTLDNLAGYRNETNNYNSAFAQIMLRITDLPYLRFAFNKNWGSNELNSAIGDPTIFNPTERNSQGMSFGIGYNVARIPFAPTQVDVSWRANADDGTMNHSPIYDNNTETINVSLISRFTQIPLRTQIGITTNSTELVLTGDKNDNINLLLRGEYSLWEDRIKPFLQYLNTSLSGDQDSQSYTHYTLGVQAFPLRDMNATTSIGCKSYANSDVSDVNYNSLTWRFMLNQRF